MYYSLPGSPVHGISQARILEWVAIPFSRGSSQPGIEPKFPALQVDSLQLSHLGSLISKDSEYYHLEIRNNLNIYNRKLVP